MPVKLQSSNIEKEEQQNLPDGRKTFHGGDYKRSLPDKWESERWGSLLTDEETA